MNMNNFADWVQEKMDTCKVQDEIETSKMMVESLKWGVRTSCRVKGITKQVIG